MTEYTALLLGSFFFFWLGSFISMGVGALFALAYVIGFSITTLKD